MSAEFNHRKCPNSQEYLKAFEAIKKDLTNDQRKLLFAHIVSPEMTASIEDMWKHTECATVEDAEKQYALIGRALIAHLEFLFENENSVPERLLSILALATPLDWTESSGREWKLRPEVINALAYARL